MKDPNPEEQMCFFMENRNEKKSASESASVKSSGGFLVGSCCFLPSYTECLTNTLKCLSLLAFASYAVRASGGGGVVRE